MSVTSLRLGFFAVATVTGIDYDVHTGRCVVTLKNIVPILEDGIAETSPRDQRPPPAKNKLKGWKAAQDVREISDAEFEQLTQGRDAEHQTSIETLDQSPMHRLRLKAQHWRDPKFGFRVYNAYGGICAISGVTLLGIDGHSDLEAAHVFPYAIEQHDQTSAGILLAPSWHRRFDSGAITIHENYTWSVNVPDTDTDAIINRILHLPRLSSDRPDRTLLERKRLLFRH